MLRAYLADESGLKKVDVAGDVVVPPEAVWLDLFEPTPGEERAAEAALGIDVPTREEMHEIEASSRLYEENGALYMTASIVTRVDTGYPETTAVTFILARNRLATLRYAEPLPFRTFVAYLEKHPGVCASSEAILVTLLEAIVDRVADVLERAGAEVDGVSRAIFSRETKFRARGFEPVMADIGRNGDLVSKVRESLLTLSRLLSYLGAAREQASKELRQRIKTIGRDIASLIDHAQFLNNKITFLLEATLGMVGIEQNATIKIFSVVAVVFLPPTLVASIYGMNFDRMPELKWDLGYPLALLMMVASAILPYLYFKYRGWL